MLVLGWRSIERCTLYFFKCPQCRDLQESLTYGVDRVARCYGCDRYLPVNDFRLVPVDGWVANCKGCNEPVSLTPKNIAYGRPLYVCPRCQNVVAVECGRDVINPTGAVTIARDGDKEWTPYEKQYSELSGLVH